MKDSFMKNFFKSSILSSVCLAALGLLLIFQSKVTIISISYIIGGILIGLGVLAIMNYLKKFNEKVQSELDIVYGTVCIVLGIVVIKNPQAIASIIPFIVGLVIIISSARKLQYGFELKKQNNSLWKSTFVISIITIICGMLLIYNPFAGAVFITKVVGFLILIYSILDIASTITIKNSLKEINNTISKNVTEATIINEEIEKEVINKEKELEFKDTEDEEEPKEENKDSSKKKDKKDKDKKDKDKEEK